MLALATDLDGTFLGSNGTAVEVNINAINQAADTGIVVFPATARSPRSTSRIAKLARFGPLVVCANGSIGYNTETDSYLWHNTLPYDEIVDLVRSLRSNFDGIRFAIEYGLEFFNENDFFKNNIFVPENKLIENISSLNLKHVTKLICRSEETSKERLSESVRQVMGDSVATAFGSTDWLEVLPPNTSKGTGVQKACQYYGVSEDSITVVGDHLNDLPMFEIAKTSAAVANAHPEVLAKADWKVGSNDHGGVSEVVQKMLGDIEV